ncbi:MAG: O-antigen ligase family protein [Williamsia sp.]|nr:O-antigen ligase family protein [Williamsia sp.]
MWMVSFGFFEGYANQEGVRQLGNYLVVNLVLASMLVVLFPTKIKLSFPGVRIYVLIMLWLILIHVYQQDYFTSVKKLSNILLTQVLMIIMANYAWKINLFKLMELFIYYIAIVMVLVIYTHLTKIGPIGIGTHLEEFRLGGLFTFGQAAAVAGIGLLLSAHQLLFNPAAKKSVYIALSLFFTYCLIACDLRTGIGAVAIAISVQYLYYLTSQNKSIFPFLIMMGVAYAGYKLYISLNESGTLVSSDLAYRQLIWSYSIPGIAKRPIVGYGTVPAFFTNNPKTLAFNAVLADPHSSYLSLMLQSGVVTLILLILFVARVVRFNMASKSFHTKAFVSIVVYWAIIGSTGGNMFSLDYDITSVFFMFSILAFCCHSSHIAANRKAILNEGMIKAYV